MYRLSVESEFSSAHSLRGYDGKCATVHGHNWRVRLTARTRILDDLGMGIDFGSLSQYLNQAIEGYDHADLNKVPPFDEINPSAENISRVIFDNVNGMLPEGLEVESVEIWESNNYKVTYTKD